MRVAASVPTNFVIIIMAIILIVNNFVKYVLKRNKNGLKKEIIQSNFVVKSQEIARRAIRTSAVNNFQQRHWK